MPRTASSTATSVAVTRSRAPLEVMSFVPTPRRASSSARSTAPMATTVSRRNPSANDVIAAQKCFPVRLRLLTRRFCHGQSPKANPAPCPEWWITKNWPGEGGFGIKEGDGHRTRQGADRRPEGRRLCRGDGRPPAGHPAVRVLHQEPPPPRLRQSEKRAPDLRQGSRGQHARRDRRSG